MADYNIYIRTVGGGDGSGSPTKPFQAGGGDGAFTEGDANQFVSKGAAFISDPDSAIGAVKDSAIGAVASKVPWIAGVILFAKIAVDVTTKCVDSYTKFQSYYGNYNPSILYSNIKRQIQLYTRPLSSYLQNFDAHMEVMRNNAKNQQEQLLFGGTILNNPYGRYL